MIDVQAWEGRELVAMVRAAAERHRVTWAAMVPDPHTINADEEQAEEAAYVAMAAAKLALREHMCRTYGISAKDLCILATL